MDAGGFKFTDPYDWETKRKHKDSCNEKNTRVSSNWMNYVADRENTTVTQTLEALNPIAESSKLPENVQAGIFKKATDNENPFPAESFATNFLGF